MQNFFDVKSERLLEPKRFERMEFFGNQTQEHPQKKEATPKRTASLAASLGDQIYRWYQMAWSSRTFLPFLASTMARCELLPRHNRKTIARIFLHHFAKGCEHLCRCFDASEICQNPLLNQKQSHLDTIAYYENRQLPC